MNYSRGYVSQVELLLKILPVINMQNCFALKGGTAINLFIRDMPRLSVDIDLTYLPIEPREQFLKNLEVNLERLAENIRLKDNRYQIDKVFTKEPKQLSKLIVSDNAARIIIEPNLVLRGGVFECEQHDLCQNAQNDFLSYFPVKTLSLPDLYDGKICAALARQHPRDLFDVKILLENEGITESIRQAFIVYLASNSRPIHELLNPKPKLQDTRKNFEESFSGMTKIPVSYEQLIDIRFKLIELILQSLTDNERKFLISVKEGNPIWELLPIDGINKLPGLIWKNINISKMNREKHTIALEKLKSVLQL